MGLRPAINPTIYSSKFLFISRDNVTAASLCPHSSDYVLGDFPQPGTELGLPQILVQLAGSIVQRLLLNVVPPGFVLLLLDDPLELPFRRRVCLQLNIGFRRLQVRTLRNLFDHRELTVMAWLAAVVA